MIPYAQRRIREIQRKLRAHDSRNPEDQLDPIDIIRLCDEMAELQARLEDWQEIEREERLSETEGTN